MKRRLLKTMVAVLAIAAAAAGPVRGQNANVSWVLTPYGNLQTGDTVVIVDKTSERAMSNNNGLSAPSAVEIELSGDQNALTAAPADTLKWVVVLNNGNYQFQVPGTDEYLYSASYVNNGVRVATGGDNQFTFETGGTNSVPFLKNAINGRYIGVYNTYNDWRCYTSSTNDNIKNTVIGFYVRTAAAPPQPHTVRFASGNDGWTVTDVDSARSATAPAVLQNVIAGDSLVATYNGTKKVKSVKAVKYVAPAATVTTAPTATAGIIEAGSTSALVNAGVANGGTMMYAVTTTNAQPASTADFSATRPTAQGRAAGTYYVWFYAKADADHSDSEIAGPVSVTVTSAPITITWNSSNISDISVSGSINQSYTKEGITLSANADMIDAWWMNYGDESGISFNVHASGGFTFTAPNGKKFTKIEMTLAGQGGWNLASLGTGWAYGENFDPMTMDDPICKVTWTGSAASTVGLLTGANDFGGTQVKSIVFTLIDAQ